MPLKQAQRDKLPNGRFGLPGQRKYPLDTKARARNALARAAQFATPAERAEIRANVKRAYPDIQVSGQ